jgi:hypothetical protein
MTTTEILIAIVGVLGSLASFYGAYLSIQAKNEAKTSAEKAEFAKDQVLKKQATTHLGELFYQAKRVQQSFGKYSITQNKGLIGTEFEKDAEVLQAYIFLFNENRALIQTSTDIETQSTYKTLNDLLDDFTKHKAADDRKGFGKQIRLAIDDIIFKLKKVIDDRNSETQ